MFPIDKILLLAGVLTLLGILSSKFSTRLGLPGLVLFIALGMLAGSEGIGKIAFGNYELAHAIGTLALAFILFDGGLQSSIDTLRIAWKPAALLATLGVLLTSLATGVVATHVLGLAPLEGLLLGSIVGSTDAAAVFGLLRSASIRLHDHLAATLEIESGANDPMAVFMTVGVIQLLTGEIAFGPQLVLLFVLQMGVGLGVGFAVGKLAVHAINRINLQAAGLYPVLASACGLLAFGLAALLQGSGFLAVYVAGLVLGNSKWVFRKGTLLFHDGMAWVGQIAMFVVLGLLSSPRALLDVARDGLFIAATLMFVARPVAVIPLLIPFGYSLRELVLVGWTGLKGAVPIVLATYPLIFGLPSGPMLFNLVFFVVLLSAVVQGGTLAWVARKLGLEKPAEAEPPFSLEIFSLRDVDADIVDYAIAEDSRAAGRMLQDLALPQGAVVAMIFRGKTLIPPRGTTRVLGGDHVFIVVDRESRDPVDRIFAHNRGRAPTALVAEFPLPGTATVGDLASLYDIHTGEPPDVTLEQLIRDRVSTVTVGAMVIISGVRLRVREMRDERISIVGLSLAEEVD